MVGVRDALLWVQNKCKDKSFLQTWVMSVMSNEVNTTSPEEGGESGELLNLWCAGCQFFTARLLAFNLGIANKLMEEFPVGSLSGKYCEFILKAVLYFQFLCKLLIDNIPTFVLSLLSFIIRSIFIVLHSLQRDRKRTKCLVALPVIPKLPVVFLMDIPMAGLCKDRQQEQGIIKAGVLSASATAQDSFSSRG